MCSLQNLKETKREKEKAIKKEREKINVCGEFHIMNRSKIFNVCSVWNSQRGFFSLFECCWFWRSVYTLGFQVKHKSLFKFPKLKFKSKLRCSYTSKTSRHRKTGNEKLVAFFAVFR